MQVNLPQHNSSLAGANLVDQPTSPKGRESSQPLAPVKEGAQQISHPALELSGLQASIEQGQPLTNLREKMLSAPSTWLN